MRRIHAVLLGGLALTLVSCGVNKSWYNPNADRFQAENDFRQCQYDATKYGYVQTSLYGNPIAAGFSAGLEQGFREIEIMNSCMRSKGYYLVPRNRTQ